MLICLTEGVIEVRRGLQSESPQQESLKQILGSVASPELHAGGAAS